jgi:hypothetical protein
VSASAGPATLLAPMDSPPSTRGGETAFSPERNSGSPAATAKEGGRGRTMGSPTQGYDSIVDSVRAAAETT